MDATLNLISKKMERRSGLIVMLAGNYIPEVHYVQAPLYLYYNSSLIDNSDRKIQNLYFDKTFTNELDFIGNVTYLVRNPILYPTAESQVQLVPLINTPAPILYNPYSADTKNEDRIDWEDWNRLVFKYYKCTGVDRLK